MLLTITTTHQPATDLGYLLHKHPDKLQTFPLAFGQAKVFYPEADERVCTAALLLDIDPVKLVRNGKEGQQQYVNDRPYVASSFLSVAISQVFGTALGGKCCHRPELVTTPIPLIARILTLPCAGGEADLRRLFKPLGYTLTLQQHPLEQADWGRSDYFSVELAHTVTLQTLLSHLYVLIPVLDADKHYWVGDEEVDKLLRHGEGWLKEHPEQQLITRRYLKNQGGLVKSALRQIGEEDNPKSKGDRSKQESEFALETPLSLNQQRLEMVVRTLKQVGAKRVLDLGCGEGKLIQQLLPEPEFTEIVGVDVDYRCLETARKRLKLDSPALNQHRIKLLQGSLTYRDKRLFGYDAAVVVEVIEHLDPFRLSTFEQVLFKFTRPKTVIITTPNVEYNVNFIFLPTGQLRHPDHRFEWTRQEFQSWCDRVAREYAYRVQFSAIGAEDPHFGAPTQMAVFQLAE